MPIAGLIINFSVFFPCVTLGSGAAVGLAVGARFEVGFTVGGGVGTGIGARIGIGFLVGEGVCIGARIGI